MSYLYRGLTNHYLELFNNTTEESEESSGSPDLHLKTFDGNQMNENISDLSMTNDITPSHPSQTDPVLKYDLLDVNQDDIPATGYFGNNDVCDNCEKDHGSEEIGKVDQNIYGKFSRTYISLCCRY